jgi:metacaspase-1
MSQGISIHIGLNHVDPDAYDGWDGELAGCHNDAHAMRGIADGLGYSSSLMLDDDATADSVLAALSEAALNAYAGDIVVVTYSGHGGQLPDETSDEPDAQDETWVLWDREVLDDELYQSYAMFSEGVRVFVLSDSCHSGTVLKMMVYEQVPKLEPLAKEYGIRKGTRTLPRKIRVVREDIQRRVYDKHKDLYTAVRSKTPRSGEVDPLASVLLISGCQDNQLSLDGSQNGLFTQTLLEVWDDGSFQGDYRKLHQDIQSTMPATQSPNFFTVGVPSPEFESQIPFTIEPAVLDGGVSGEVSGGVTSGVLSVNGPPSWPSEGDSPEFTADTAGAPYWIFEAATEASLFADWEQQTTENFYATWSDPESPSRLTGTSFSLPEYAWEQLKGSSGLFYRIGTTTSLTDWDDYTVSTPDDAAEGEFQFMAIE